jgi:dephospho-CoA kinase
MIFRLGLTGSIGMGKSTTAAMFRRAGIPVHDADASVHRLYAGAAVAPVESAFPGVTQNGVIDRTLLKARVMADDAAMKRLEAIVHPLVRAEAQRDIAAAIHARAPLIVLDIPLLFETGRDTICDAVAVVTAAAEIQRARVLARPGMDEATLAAILARQMPDAEKRRRAHFVIDTGHGLAAAENQVQAIIRSLAGRSGRA